MGEVRHESTETFIERRQRARVKCIEDTLVHIPTAEGDFDARTTRFGEFASEQATASEVIRAVVAG